MIHEHAIFFLSLDRCFSENRNSTSWLVRIIVIWIYREPRGFGFVKYRYGEDAAEAKQQLNHTVIGGREIRIVFAEENRKTPQEMRTNSRIRCIQFSLVLQMRKLYVRISATKYDLFIL